MTQETPSISREQVDRVRDKIQALYDSLPEDEKPVMAAILRQAAQAAEVSGYQENDIFVLQFLLEFISTAGLQQQSVALPVSNTSIIQGGSFSAAGPTGTTIQGGPTIVTG